MQDNLLKIVPPGPVKVIINIINKLKDKNLDKLLHHNNWQHKLVFHLIYLNH